MPKQLYLLDTVNAIQNYDTFLRNETHHTFNVLFPFKFPIINIKSITLKSVQMPFRILTTRQETASINFYIKFNYGSFNNKKITIDLSEKQYTNIDDILTRINEITEELLYIYSYTGVTISFSAQSIQFSDKRIAITHNCSYIEIEKTPFTTDVLGFNSRLISNGIALYGTSPYNLNGSGDPCIYMNITNLPIMNHNIPSKYTFKIPLDGKSISNNILYYNDPYENQTIYFNDSNFVLDKLNIVICDRNGCQLMGYYNWSFTLIIDYDDDNKQIEYLNIYN
jgi:hypothetical protein